MLDPYARHHQHKKHGDARSDGAVDRDRILHSSAFRRLEGVTQVVGPDEGHMFHNRLTHSLKVGQIARRIAELCNARVEHLPVEVRRPDPEVAEAAGLAHDLGHPPFGHVAEKALDECVIKAGLSDGYEGNAQTFRILTKLAVRNDEDGLDLTRASLNAVLKYPWLRASSKKDKRHGKWGAYETEQSDFDFARGGRANDAGTSIEAKCMELADDIAYSIHDAEDFYRAGLVPVESLAREDSLESLRFLDRALVRLQVNDDSHRKRLEAAFRQSMTFCAIEEPYRGTKLQRVALKAWASGQIQQFVNSIDVVEHDEELSLDVPQETKDTLSIPKQLTWQYVILNSRLATQQVGHDRVIRELFAEYVDAIEQRRWTVLPPRFADEAERFASDAKRREALWGKLDEKQHAARLAADVIASMSDREALAMHRRLRGFSPGSVLEALVL